jgi:hypothetical protein
METFRKVPTCLLYDERGQVMAWGLEAKSANAAPGCIKCEWYETGGFLLLLHELEHATLFFRFKLFLEPHALRDQSTADPRLPPIPVRKQFIRDRVS